MSELYRSVQYAHYAHWSKNLLRLKICSDSVQFQKKIPKISHWGSSYTKYVELGYFTLLFCRWRVENVPRFKTHV